MKKSKYFYFRIMAIFLFALFFDVWSVEWCGAQNMTKIDWLQGYVSATGRGYAKKTGTPMDNDRAVTAAKVIAKRELLEAIKGVKIDYQTAVSDLITESNETSARVQGVLHNAVQVGTPQIKEEGNYVIAVVEMRVCLFENGSVCKSDQSLVSVLPKSSKTKEKENLSCDLLPNITSTKEILSKITYDTNQPLAIFVVNMKGSPFNASSRDFAIGFKTNNGNNCSVYSPEKVDPLVRRDRGTAELFIHVSDAKRKYGANLVAIEAKAIDNNNYIVIDGKDAYLMNLLNERENQLLFKQARIGVAAQD
jgi:hypothetical protein